MLYLLFISYQKPFNQLYITNKTEAAQSTSVFKVGMPCVLQSLQRQPGL